MTNRADEGNSCNAVAHAMVRDEVVEGNRRVVAQIPLTQPPHEPVQRSFRSRMRSQVHEHRLHFHQQVDWHSERLVSHQNLSMSIEFANGSFSPFVVIAISFQ